MKDGKIRLHGREYKTVALRVQEFRRDHPAAEGWGILTTPHIITDDVVIFRAAIVDNAGREVAVGFAEERRTAKGINATSALENCETSAIGRALAAAGYGGTEYASADELTHALQAQAAAGGAAQPPAHSSWRGDARAQFLGALQERGLAFDDVATFTTSKGWQTPAQWETQERRAFIRDLDAGAHPVIYQPPEEERVELDPGVVA